MFEVEYWQGDLCLTDLDEAVDDACFFALPHAIEKLGQGSWPMMRDLILAHLAGQTVPGTL